MVLRQHSPAWRSSMRDLGASVKAPVGAGLRQVKQFPDI
ncbi:hypothetical protein GWL_40870 [Herbaspirillum sp. GW103]|nr:hypothetical protein GWL_40870 [Herbaspirillum sp. GW103]